DRRAARAARGAHHHPAGRAERELRPQPGRHGRGDGRRPRRARRTDGRVRRGRGAAAAPARAVARERSLKENRRPMSTDSSAIASPARPGQGPGASGPAPAGADDAVQVTPPRDWAPVLLIPVLMLAMLPLVGSASSWVTLTVAGLAMGLIIFVIASGLTLVFGLMDVLNFGHGVFITLGAFVATSVFAPMVGLTTADSIGLNLVAMFVAMLVAMTAAGALGVACGRFIVAPVYGQHVKQILITMGGMIIGEELIKVIWGPDAIPLPLPTAMRGSIFLG